MKITLNHRNVTAVMAAALVVAALGCEDSRDTVKSTSETTETAGDTTKKTTTESTQVGSTLETKSTTKVDGEARATVEQFVGTVTAYKPGKSIEVMTGETKTTSFDLDQKELQASVEPSIVVGSRVRLTRNKTSDGNLRISVVPDHS